MGDNLFAPLRKGDAFGVEPEADAFGFQSLLDGHGDVSSSTLYQARPHLHDSNVASQPAKDLPELQPHVTAAHNDQSLWNEVDVHHRVVGDILDVLDPGHRRHGCAPTDVDEDLIGG